MHAITRPSQNVTDFRSVWTEDAIKLIQKNISANNAWWYLQSGLTGGTRADIMLLIVHYPCSRKLRTSDHNSSLHFSSGARDVISSLRHIRQLQQQPQQWRQLLPNITSQAHTSGHARAYSIRSLQLVGAAAATTTSATAAARAVCASCARHHANLRSTGPSSSIRFYRVVSACIEPHATLLLTYSPARAQKWSQDCITQCHLLQVVATSHWP